MKLASHASEADKKVIALIGQERYNRLRVLAQEALQRPSQEALARFTAVVEEMSPEQRVAVWNALTGMGYGR